MAISLVFDNYLLYFTVVAFVVSVTVAANIHFIIILA